MIIRAVDVDRYSPAVARAIKENYEPGNTANRPALPTNSDRENSLCAFKLTKGAF